MLIELFSVAKSTAAAAPRWPRHHSLHAPIARRARDTHVPTAEDPTISKREGWSSSADFREGEASGGIRRLTG